MGVGMGLMTVSYNVYFLVESLNNEKLVQYVDRLFFGPWRTIQISSFWVDIIFPGLQVWWFCVAIGVKMM